MTVEVKTPTEELPYRLWEEDGMWVAKDERTGVASQGETRGKALKNLEEAITLHKSRGSSNQREEDRILEDLGVEPAEVKKAREKKKDLPDFMR